MQETKGKPVEDERAEYCRVQSFAIGICRMKLYFGVCQSAQSQEQTRISELQAV
jgi:hypothetical protein